MMEKRPRKMWLGWLTAFGLLWTASAQAGVEARALVSAELPNVLLLDDGHAQAQTRGDVHLDAQG